MLSVIKVLIACYSEGFGRKELLNSGEEKLSFSSFSSGNTTQSICDKWAAIAKKILFCGFSCTTDFLQMLKVKIPRLVLNILRSMCGAEMSVGCVGSLYNRDVSTVLQKTVNANWVDDAPLQMYLPNACKQFWIFGYKML